MGLSMKLWTGLMCSLTDSLKPKLRGLSSKKRDFKSSKNSDFYTKYWRSLGSVYQLFVSIFSKVVFDSRLPVYSTERDVEDVLSTRPCKAKSYAYQRNSKQVVDYADGGGVILSPQCHFRITMTPNRYFFLGFQISFFWFSKLWCLAYVKTFYMGVLCCMGFLEVTFGAEIGLLDCYFPKWCGSQSLMVRLTC